MSMERDGPAVATPGEIVTLLDCAAQARNGLLPTAELRYYTDYFKRRPCNSWFQENQLLLGAQSVLLSGERRAERTSHSTLLAYQWHCALQPCHAWPGAALPVGTAAA